jgi:hypothetical protein
MGPQYDLIPILGHGRTASVPLLLRSLRFLCGQGLRRFLYAIERARPLQWSFMGTTDINPKDK